MKIFSTKQIAAIDRYTIEHEPISDLDLMERASTQIARRLMELLPVQTEVAVFAGPGNNGGDAMAVARLLAAEGYQVRIFRLNAMREPTGSPAVNWQRLREQGKVLIAEIYSLDDFPQLKPSEVVIDGLFGSGLSRALDGLAAAVVQRINNSGCRIVAIDIPSGLHGEDNSQSEPEAIIKAGQTLTLQFPKLGFMFAENAPFVGRWEVLPIGLHPQAIEQTATHWNYLNAAAVANMLPARETFAHKGTFGHALLIAGSYGKMGAAVLASRACLRAGVGLLTTHIPHWGYPIIQTAVPEAMTSIDASDLMFTEFPDLSQFTAVGIGPGLGIKTNTKRGVRSLLDEASGRMVLDADALNILGENKEWLSMLPPGAILTPHPKEFERLAGPSATSYERLQKQVALSEKYRIVVVLKGAHTSVSLPDGRVFFNSTGNPGMATAGSGDVLTGVILGLLAQSIPAEQAALAGVYVHGLAGDLAAGIMGQWGMTATDIRDQLPATLRGIVGK